MLEKLLFLFILSMTPVIELRGAIPMGVLWEIPFWLNYTVCVIGNILPVPFLVLFARKVLFFLAKNKHFGHLFQKIIDVGNSKMDKLGKYELLGIFLFVAVPLPGTGAWTGSLIATLLQLRLLPSFIAISPGVMASGLIMFLASSGLLGFLGIVF